MWLRNYITKSETVNIAYEKLLDWWSKHTYGRHLYIGHGIYRVAPNAPAAWKNPNEFLIK